MGFGHHHGAQGGGETRLFATLVDLFDGGVGFPGDQERVGAGDGAPARQQRREGAGLSLDRIEPGIATPKRARGSRQARSDPPPLTVVPRSTSCCAASSWFHSRWVNAMLA